MTRPDKHLNNADIPAAKSSTLCEAETIRVASALVDDRITLFFQPIVRAGSDNLVAFYEGLARIKMPSGQIISAGQFMPFVENTPLGIEVDRRVLQLGLISLDNNPDIRLSINISVSTMSDPVWLEIINGAPLNACERLIIEITEHAAMSNVDHTTAFMHHVRKKGCSIAMDDFGAGATSFRYFKDFLFDFVKIDGLFIRDLAYDKGNQVLVKALINISKHYDMVTVAEFVETSGEAGMATKLGVDCLQGYLIGEPTPKPVALTCETYENRKIAG